MPQIRVGTCVSFPVFGLPVDGKIVAILNAKEVEVETPNGRHFTRAIAKLAPPKEVH